MYHLAPYEIFTDTHKGSGKLLSGNAQDNVSGIVYKLGTVLMNMQSSWIFQQPGKVRLLSTALIAFPSLSNLIDPE